MDGCNREMEPEYVPQEADQSKIRDIRVDFERCAHNMKTFLPEGRYKALALTALEEGCMWAVKAESHRMVKS